MKRNREIARIIQKHEESIIEHIKELERTYAKRGVYNTYDTIRILFDLRDFKIYEQIVGQGISQEVYEGIEAGEVVEVYSFTSGYLEEMALEGLDYSTDNGEAEKLYSEYKNGEVSEDEYFEKYDEVVRPWIDEYMEDYLNNSVQIEVDYFNAIENE